MTTTARAIILDTDIGSDVDDAVALGMLFGTPGLDLLGVTTVYGDPLLRARLAKRYAWLAGRELPVRAGRAETRSGKPAWWAGHEGSLHAGLAAEDVDPGDGVEFLVETVLARPGEVDVVAIGPLTDLAAALDASPAFAPAVRSFCLMGGAFGTETIEHNFACDVAATQRVFAARVPTVVTGLEITTRVGLGPEHVARIAAAGAFGAALAADIAQWVAFRGHELSTPHDPLAVLTLLRPDLFTLSGPGTIGVDDDGRSQFRTDPTGAHRIVVDLDVDASAAAIVAAVVAAGRSPAVR